MMKADDAQSHLIVNDHYIFLVSALACNKKLARNRHSLEDFENTNEKLTIDLVSLIYETVQRTSKDKVRLCFKHQEMKDLLQLYVDNTDFTNKLTTFRKGLLALLDYVQTL